MTLYIDWYSYPGIICYRYLANPDSGEYQGIQMPGHSLCPTLQSVGSLLSLRLRNSSSSCHPLQLYSLVSWPIWILTVHPQCIHSIQIFLWRPFEVTTQKRSQLQCGRKGRFSNAAWFLTANSLEVTVNWWLLLCDNSAMEIIWLHSYMLLAIG